MSFFVVELCNMIYNKHIMLDKQSYKLLNILGTFCTDGSYKIIETSDLLKQMPSNYNVDVVLLDQLLRYLANNEMIDIKYKDDKVYCVSVLSKGRVYTEMLPGKQKVMLPNTSVRRYSWFFMAGMFASAFLGALVAGLIVGLV